MAGMDGQMKIAIVGTSHTLTKNEEQDIEQYITHIISKYGIGDEIISGGAKGVDTLGLEVAKGLGFKTEVYEPEVNEWTPPNGKIGYKKRNLKIAKTCDELYCITIPKRKGEPECYHHDPPQDHTKTAGCWTLKEALKLGKTTHLMVITAR